MYLFIFLAAFNTLVGSVILFFAWNYALRLIIPSINSINFLASSVIILFILWLQGYLKLNATNTH